MQPMARQKISSSTPFEFDGFWWLPSADQPERRAQGFFTWDPANGGHLKIIDLRADASSALDPLNLIPVLHGCNLQGKPCTLFDVMPISLETNLFGGHVKEILQSNSLVYGMHLDSIDQLMVRDAIVGIEGLRQWVNHHWIKPRKSTAEEEVAADDLLENDVLNVSLGDGNLLIARGISNREGQLTDKKRDATVNAQFHLDSPVAFEDFHERYSLALADLLVLTGHQPSRIIFETILAPSESIEWCGVDRPESSVDDVQVVQRTTLEPLPDNPHAFELIPMPLRAWEDGATEVIGQWFTLRAALEGPGDLFFATLNKAHVELESDTLALLSASEGYHRVSSDDPPFSEEEHRAALEVMLNGLKEPKQEEHYRTKLRHANQQSQKQRLRDLFDRAEWILPEIESWRRKQLQALVNTRNYFVHWGERSDDLLEDWDLWAALNRLRIVLEINLYLDLGVDPDVIEIAIRMANRKRKFMEEA
jgi:ApeA N-terminal domain 1